MIPFKEHIGKADLYPFTLLRETYDLFAGAMTNKERWLLAADIYEFTLQDIPANVIPFSSFWEIFQKKGVEAALLDSTHFATIDRNNDFILNNEKIISSDIELLKKTTSFQPIPDHVRITGSTDNVFLEEGAELEHITINTKGGPVYISKGTLIMDGACLRGPLFIGKNSVIKMGATLYGGTSIGEKVIAGGEIKNSIINSFSNKAHDGYLGDSIIGEWCNLGASTTVSNLKNTASDVMVWNMFRKTYESAGKKCGTFMGDFSRTSINSTLNTGTVIGICSNLVPTNKNIPKYIPNFTWLQDEIETYTLDKAFSDIQNWMRFKNKEITNELKDKLSSIFNSHTL